MDMKKAAVLVCVALMGVSSFAYTLMGPPTAELSMLVVSPGTLTAGDFQLVVDGGPESLGVRVREMHRAVQHRVVLVVERAPDVRDLHAASLNRIVPEVRRRWVGIRLVAEIDRE